MSYFAFTRRVESHSEVIPKMSTPARTSCKTFAAIEKQLKSLRNSFHKRINLHRMDFPIDREPDDEVAAACENVSREMLAATLDRDRRTLIEIESALNRLNSGRYGTCDHCGLAIARARLEALPWARLCIHCAERGMNPSRLRIAF
jgi:RNA polymerase-binding protein DksA